MIDWQRTVLSQYVDSPTIMRQLESLNDWLDPTADFQAFYDLVWNLDTAVGYGLDVWGRIVNVKRTISVPNTYKTFGFVVHSSPAEEFAPFNVAPFARQGGATTLNYRLADDAYRRLIYVKALSNISGCAIPVLNVLLQLLFPGRGRCYVSDLGHMKMRYTFEFTLMTWEVALLIKSNVMIRPTGVLASLLQIPRGKTFGFREMGSSALPFNVGAFVSQVPVVGLVTPLGEINLNWDNHPIDGVDYQHLDGVAHYP